MKAEYIDHMGDDLRVANAARVSFDKESALEDIVAVRKGLKTTWENDDYGTLQPVSSVDDLSMVVGKKLKDADVRIIKYLARENHFTPFTHGVITLRETVPIFVARQRFKHTVGFTYNEISRRYVDSKPELYQPTEWRKRPEGSVKQGSSHETVRDLVEPMISVDAYRQVRDTYTIAAAVEDLFYDALDTYVSLLEAGVCPEQARMVLPQAMMTSYYVTGSLAAFARAYGLRKDPHAQLEIQVLADQWDEIIRPLFPHSWSALLGDNT